MATSSVLRTRLLPPRLPPDCVARPRLVEAILRGLEGDVVTVVAGAGYGKSTLLVQAYDADIRSWAWLSCDGRIPDGRSLIAHVGAALSHHLPGIEARIGGSGDPVEMIEDLANELYDSLTEDMVIALDDVQTLTPTAAASIEPLAASLPPAAHLLLASRVALPISAARLRSARGVALDESHLKMRNDEAAGLLASLGLALSDSESDRIREVTEGWAAGLVLAAQSGGELADVDELSKDQFDYLADEVLARQPDELQRFLLGTSAVSRFSPELAAALTGLKGAGSLAQELVRRRLFTVRLDAGGEWYRYHHLFLEFLRRRAVAEAPGALVEQHRRAAEWWARQGERTEAVGHHIAAGKPAAALDALEPIAQDLAGTSEAETLAAWLEAIPSELWEERPKLVLANASVLMTRARHEEAFAESEKAIEYLLKAGEHDGAAGALVRLQQSMVAAGTRPTRRIDVRRFVERLDPSAPLADVARSLLATAHGYACQFDEARRQLDAVESRDPEPTVALMAAVARGFYVDFWVGQPQRALERYRGIRERIEGMSEDPLALLPTTMMLEVYMCNELGLYEETRELTSRLEDIWSSAGLGSRALRRAEAWVRGTWLAGAEEWAELEATLPPPPAPDPRNASSYAYRYRVLTARLAAHRGEAQAVGEQIRACLDAMDAFEPVFDDATFLCDLGLAAWRVGRSADATALAERARKRAEAVGSPWLRGRQAVVAALASPSESETLEALQRALQLTEEHELALLWTHREREHAPSLLAQAVDHGLGPEGTAERMLAAAGGEAVAAALRCSDVPETRRRISHLAAEARDLDLNLVDTLMRDRDEAVQEEARCLRAQVLGRPRAAIGIRSLGHLEVFRDGVLVPATAFSSPESRRFFARLLASGGSADIADWSDVDSALPDLRRALQPELAPEDTSALIAIEGTTAHLSLTPADSWDVQILRELAGTDAPLDRLDALLDAEELLGGAFLAEWPDAPWATGPRGEIVEMQVTLLGELSELLAEAGRQNDATKRFARLVERDPEEERWQRGLMSTLAAEGKQALALRQFQTHRARLRRQGREPGQETQDLYAEIVLRQHAQESPRGRGTVTIVFTDIESSTTIAERLGDSTWADVVRAHDRLASREAVVRGGRLIKSQGDGVMLAFPLASSAVEFAVAFQRRLHSDSDATAGERLRVRIGLHTGEAVREGEDYLGRTVIVASRIADLGTGGQIVSSSTTRELVAGSELARVFGPAEDAALKGLAEAHRVHRVEWRETIAESLG